MAWTAEELAEMAAADAEIEAEFEDEATAYRLAREDTEYAAELERTARADSLTRAEENRKRKIAAYQKAYYEANKDEIAAYKKAYYEANKDEIAAYQKAYYEANKDEIAACQKAYREANKDEIAACQKAYREANKETNGPCDALRTYRKEHGYTQRDLAKILGVSQSIISQYESGKVPFDMSDLDARIAANAREN